MHMQPRRRLLHGRDDIQIALARVVRMNSTLETDFGRATLPSFERSLRYFFEIQVVSGTSQRSTRTTLREGAEAAGIATDVGVVDVAVDDISHIVARHLGPQLVASAHDGGEVRSVGV